MGSYEDKHIWVEDKVETWVAGVKRLEKFSKEFHQTAYIGWKISLHQEWNPVQHVTPSVGTLFEPLEKAFQCKFIL